MFAVIKTGGKQYKVANEDVLIVEKLSANAGDLIRFGEVLMVSDQKVEIGAPYIVGAAVNARVLDQIKSKKVVSFVKRRRKNSSKRTKGHRQNKTVLKITDILKKVSSTEGSPIDPGVSLIEKAKGPVSIKTEPTKKAAARTETSKKAETKAKLTKKVADKTETPKKAVAKAEAANKAPAKAKTAKKSVAKTEPTKKAVAQTEPSKKSVSKSKPGQKVVSKMDAGNASISKSKKDT